MSRDDVARVLAEEVLKYPRALRQRIVLIDPVRKQGGGRSGGYFSHRVPVTKHRQRTLTCGHTWTDSCEGRVGLPKRAVGDRELCEQCALDPGTSPGYLTPNMLLRMMGVRTRASWLVLYRPEVRDPRLDEFFAATAKWFREGRESEDSMYARRAAALPAVLNIVLRDPVQEAE